VVDGEEQRVEILARRYHWRKAAIFLEAGEMGFHELPGYADGMVLKGVQATRDLGDYV
jgi:hypothetical protein